VHFIHYYLIINGSDTDIPNGMLEIFSAEGRLIHREALIRDEDYFESSIIDTMSNGVYLIHIYGNSENGQGFSSSLKIVVH